MHTCTCQAVCAQSDWAGEVRGEVGRWGCGRSYGNIQSRARVGVEEERDAMLPQETATSVVLLNAPDGGDWVSASLQ